MAHGTIEFFTSSSPFSFPGWTYQQPGGTRGNKDYANELGADGDEIANGTNNPKTEGSWTFLLADSVEVGEDLPIPNVGQISSSGGWHLDSIQIGWDRAQLRPKLTANAHKHDAGTAHGATGGHDCREYAASVTIKAVAFGVPADLGGVKLADGAVVDWRDATYTLECSHVDELGRSGNELAGDNYDGVETISANLTGNWTDDDLTVTSGWTRTGDGVTPSNTGATTGNVNYIHHVAHYVAQSNG